MDIKVWLRAFIFATSFIIITTSAVPGTNAQVADVQKSSSHCGTDAVLANLSASARDELRKSAVVPLVPANELLLYIHVPTATGTRIFPGTSPDATGFRSTIVNAQRIVGRPDLTQQNINRIIALVKDDFSPFNIRFTTDYNDFLAYPTQNKHICIVSRFPSEIGQGSGISGVAPLAGFGLRTPSNPSFVFAQAIGVNNPEVIAEVISHEVAHTLGLLHQRNYTASCDPAGEYHPTIGTGPLAFSPIMGGGIGGITNWWSQECLNEVGLVQHDFDMLSSVVALAPDDLGNPSQLADPDAPLATLPFTGVLNTAGDSDAIRVSLATDAVLRAMSGNADLQASVFETDGTLIGTFNDVGAPNVQFDVTAGTKDIVISAVSNSNMDAQFMTGQYTVMKLAQCTPGEKTWDGGGSTNNWSDAGNWTCDAVPLSTDIAIFDGNSIKDSMIDTSIFVKGLRVNTGYIGTITESPGSLVFLGMNDVITDSNFDSGIFNCADGQFQLFNTNYTQNGGTFNCQSGAFTQNGGSRMTLTGGVLNSPDSGLVLLGQYDQSGGSFNCGVGTIDVASNGGFNLSGGHFDCTNATIVSNGGTFNLTGGIFDLPSDTATFGFDGGGASITRGPAATINHNNGTVILRQGTFMFTGSPQDFNNVIVSTRQSGVRGTMRVLGSLDLHSGTVADDSATGFVDVLGSMTIAQAYSGLGSSATFRILGNNTRTITLPVGMVGRFNPFIINAPNTTIEGSGPGQIQFSSASLISGNFNGNGSAIELGLFAQSGGLFTCGGGLITTTSNNPLPFTDGTFDCTSSDVESGGGTFEITGGTFKMPAGTFKLGTVSRSSLNISSSAIFDTSGGTLDLIIGAVRLDNGAGTRDFNNVITRNVVIDGTLKVLGTLNMETGYVRGGILEASGPVNISSTYGEHPGSCCVENLLRLTGNAVRTVTIPSTIPARFQGLDINAPNTTVQLSGSGTAPLSNITLDQGRFETAAASIEVNSNGSGGLFTQNGGQFVGGGGTLTFRDRFVLNGGSFNSGPSDFTMSNHPFGSTMTLNGGTFTAPSGTLMLGTADLTRDAAANFNHNNGTLNVTGNTSRIKFSGGATATDFNNVVVNIANNNRFVSENTVRILGDLDLQNGSLGGATFEAHKNVTISSTFTDAGSDDPADFVFAGGNSQTFTNNGGFPPSGFLTVNKTVGSTLTAATDLVQSFSPGLGVQPFNITSGSLYLANTSDLTTVGPLSIGPNGKLVSDSATTITLGNNLVNNGVIDLQGGGAGCPETDTILIRSTNSTQRSWTGSGRYRLVDVDVQNMIGSGQKIVFSGTNSGGNNASWDFSNGNNCPTALSLTPSNAAVQTGTQRQFTAGGGFAPYAFSIVTNNSGGSINLATGLYAAGTTAGATDSVRVTDGFGATADATINTFGTANKLAFSVQPGNTVAGSAISPGVAVTVQDQVGNTVANSSASITISIANNPSGGTLSGSTLTKNAVNGVATFSDLSINRAGTGYTLRVVSGVLTNATSTPFDISAAAASQLSFNVQPSNANINTSIAPAIKVSVLDASGNPITSSTALITLAFGANPASASLSGTVTRNAVGGIATFDDIAIDKSGVGFTLTAASAPLTGSTSGAFNIVDPFAVTNTNDSGAGSLRQIITDSNAAAGVQVISFNIPGSAPHTISIASNLPDLTDAVIDGTTQPGFAGAPVIELTKSAGSTAAYGLFVRGSVVKGLVIGGFATGVRINGFSPSTPSGTLIQGNYIGTNVGGTASHANARGIVAENGDFTIEGNLISGNLSEGIAVEGTTAGSANLTSAIKHNIIGSDISGLAPIPNNSGIKLKPTALGTTFGPTLIGGMTADANLIAFNLHTGVFVRGFDKVSILANRIHSNGFLGVDLKTTSDETSAEVTRNDPGDTDLGSNQLQNYPVLSAATTFGGTSSVSGTLNSKPSQSYRVELFSSPSCDATGFGEGETFIGATDVTTDASGITAFTADLPLSTAIGRVITATATDASGNTSEFSQCRGVVAAVFSVSGRIADSSNNPMQGVAVNIQGSRRATTTDSNGNYSFNALPAGVDYTVVPRLANATFAPASRTFTKLSANQSNQNFTGTRLATIQGRVQSNFNGTLFAVSGVTVTLNGAANQTAVTDTNGNYSFVSLAPGSYTVAPTHENFNFSPPATNVSLTGVIQTVDILATPIENSAGRIAFIGGNGSISEMNPDGSAKVNSINNLLGCTSVAISPNGGKLVTDCTGTTGGIFSKPIITMNFDGSQQQTVRTAGINHHPVWSPDGAKIAFIDGLDAASFIRTMNADGSNVTTIGGQGQYTELNWSPDGTKILFSKKVGSLSQIFVINANGTGTLQLTTTGSNAFSRWSPDGTKIVFIRNSSTAFLFTGNIFSMNPDGTAQTQITFDGVFRDIDWSPDGTKLGFLRNSSPTFGTMDPNGTHRVAITNASSINATPNGIAWGKTFSPVTTTGSNVAVNAGSVNVTFGNVGNAGATSVIPIPPTSAGILPGGYVIGGQAFEISTTANVTPPITVCFSVPATAAPTTAAFNQISVMHNEGGVLVDRTISRTFATRTICAQTTSLSPFAIAEQVDSSLAQISGVVLDTNGDPISGVVLSLSGSEERTTQTDSSGAFHFVNLASGGNYNVKPKHVGYLFTDSDKDIVELTGEQAVLFEGQAATFSISGRITGDVAGGVTALNIRLIGSADLVTQPDADGNYAFTELPADGSYIVKPDNVLNGFSPLLTSVDPLSNSPTGVDFVATAPTAAGVRITGRLRTVDGRGIRNAFVTITGPNGSVMQTVTGIGGTFEFKDIEVGKSYIMAARSRRFTFAPQIVSVVDEIADLELIAQ